MSYIYVLKQTALVGFLLNAEFCLIYTRVNLTAARNPHSKHPWDLGFVAGSFLLCQKSCPSCCWKREPIPNPSGVKEAQATGIFPGWIWGPALSRRSQVSPLQLGMGCGSQPEPRSRNKLLSYSELLPRVCKNPQISNFLPLSHLLLLLLPSPHCSKKQTQRGENLPPKFKDKLQTGRESQPIYYPSAASDAAFPPPETTGFSLSYLSFFQEFSDARVTTVFLSERLHWNIFQWSSVLCTFCCLEHSHKKNCSRLNLGILSVITEVIAFL